MPRSQLVTLSSALLVASACAGQTSPPASTSSTPSTPSSADASTASSPTSTISSANPSSTPHIAATASASASSKIAQASTPAYEATAALVWVKPDLGKAAIVTRWVEEKQGVASVERERPLAIVAADDSLWSITTSTLKRKLCPCTGTAVSPDDLTNTKLSATRLASKKLVTITKAEPEGFPKCSGDLASYDSAINIVGVVGSIVVYDKTETGMGCVAAHPYYGDSPGYFDVAASADVTVVPPQSALAGLVAESSAIVRKEFGDCISDPDEPTRFFSVKPSFSSQGAMTARYMFTHEAPYVCGVGPTHYTVPAELDAKAIPAQFESYKQAPAWLAAYLGANHEHVIGVSPLPAKLDRAAAVSQFDRAR